MHTGEWITKSASQERSGLRSARIDCFKDVLGYGDAIGGPVAMNVFLLLGSVPIYIHDLVICVHADGYMIVIFA